LPSTQSLCAPHSSQTPNPWSFQLSTLAPLMTGQSFYSGLPLLIRSIVTDVNPNNMSLSQEMRTWLRVGLSEILHHVPNPRGWTIGISSPFNLGMASYVHNVHISNIFLVYCITMDKESQNIYFCFLYKV